MFQKFGRRHGSLVVGLLVLGVLALFGRAQVATPAAGQAKPPQASAFPEKLLEGSLRSFDLAILAHGDLRGNFGPCG